MTLYKRKFTWSSLLVLNNKALILYASSTKSYMIYGLKQTPRVWYDKLIQDHVHFGFVHSKCNHSLFICSHQQVSVYALVYVDYILITGTSSILIHKMIDSPHTTFALKKLGTREYFPGIEIKSLSTSGLFLLKPSTSMIFFLRQKIGMKMELQLICSQTANLVSMTWIHYRTLIYIVLLLVRLHILFGVNKACQFIASPLDLHWATLKRIPRYLSGIITHSLLLSPAPMS